jgi:transcriptional antiterminator NusG
MGKQDQKVEMSIGIIVNDKVRITSGPLVGMEGLIKRINRHKRVANLSLEMFGGVTDFQVGLEIIEKVEY